MHLNRSGKDIIIGLDTEEEAVGLHAFLSGLAHTVPVETAQKGQFIYDWFFKSIQKLAQSYETEKSLSTQSSETAQIPRSQPAAQSPSRRRKG